MRLRVVAPAIALAILTLSAPPATADEPSYVEEAVQGLQSGNIYVSPSVTTVSSSTLENLQATAEAEDIGIAILPAQAADETGGDVVEFMREVTVQTDHDTVVVVIGNDLEAGSRVLEQGTAGKLANDAERSSSSTGEALTQFVNAVASQEQPHSSNDHASSSDGGGFSFMLGGTVILACAVAAGGTIVFRRFFSPSSVKEATEDFKNSPRTVREELQKITSMLPAVTDPHVVRTLRDAVTNTNAFFARAEKKRAQKLAKAPDATSREEVEKEARKDAENILKIVYMLRQMLETYIDAQQNPRFYDNPIELLATGSQAADDYDGYIIGCIRSNTTGDAFEFDKATRMIEANRSRFGNQ